MRVYFLPDDKGICREAMVFDFGHKIRGLQWHRSRPIRIEIPILELNAAICVMGINHVQKYIATVLMPACAVTEHHPIVLKLE